MSNTAKTIELLAAASYNNNYMPLSQIIFGERFPLCCFGFSAEFFFDNLGDPEGEARIASLARGYYEEAAAKPNIAVGEDRQRKISSADQVDEFIDREIRNLKKDRPLSFYFECEIEDTQLSWYKISLLIDSKTYPYAVSVYFTWPLIDDAGEIERYIARFVRFAEACRATYAVAGLALLYDTYASVGPEACFPFYKRFPGLVYADADSFAMARGRRRHVIRDVNWLTAVSGDAAAQLGDWRLGGEATTVPYDGGVIFRAGPRPMLGDTNRRDVPKLYKDVGRILRPLRLEDIGSIGYLRVPSLFDRRQESLDWFSRFDP